MSRDFVIKGMGGLHGETILEKDGRVLNEQYFIVGKTGTAKGILAEGLAECLHDEDYTVIHITDRKDTFEAAFAMFEPTNKFHLSMLKRFGLEKSKKSVKLYHPFTFNLPASLLPSIKFFTFPLTEIAREPLGFLLECDPESTPDSMALFEQFRHEANKDTTIHDILYKIYLQVSTFQTDKKREIKGNFGYLTKIKSTGTMTEVKVLDKIFNVFMRDYMIMPQSSKYNLDIEKVMSDNKSYHVLSTRWIEDEKMKAFVMFMWIYLIIKYLLKSSKPICLVIDEVPRFAPINATGYKRHFANILSELAIVRNKGEGISSILMAQRPTIDAKVASAISKTYIGSIDEIKEIQNIKKGTSASYGSTILSLNKGEFIRLKGKDELIRIFQTIFPTHAHKEQGDHFIKMYKKEYPDLLKRYTDIVSEIRQFKQDSERKVYEHSKKLVEKEEKENEESDKAATEEKPIKDKAKEELKKMHRQELDRRDQLIIDRKNKGEGYKDIAEEIKKTFSKRYHISSRRIGQLYNQLKDKDKYVVVDTDKPVPKGPFEAPRDTFD